MIPIEKLAPADLWQHNVNEGYIEKMEANGLTLARRSAKVAAESHWNEATILGPIVVSHGGLVLARGFNKILTPDMPDFPESRVENWPFDGNYVLTRLYDGVQGLIYRTVMGGMAVVTEHGFGSEATKWANNIYRLHHGAATWPQNFTPVVEVVWDKLPTVTRSLHNGLVLLGLVHIESGWVLGYDDTKNYAIQNGMRMVERLPENENALHMEQRGYCSILNFDAFTPPIMVKIENDQYKKTKELMAQLTQWDIYEQFRKGDLDYHRSFNTQRELPLSWRRWFFMQGQQLRNNYDAKNKEVDNLLASIPAEYQLIGQKIHWLWKQSMQPADYSLPYAKIIGNAQYSDLLWKKLAGEVSKTPYLAK